MALGSYIAISSNQSEQVRFSPIVVAACTGCAIYTDIWEPANRGGLAVCLAKRPQRLHQESCGLSNFRKWHLREAGKDPKSSIRTIVKLAASLGRRP
jgi:hypothetical protein